MSDASKERIETPGPSGDPVRALIALKVEQALQSYARLVRGFEELIKITYRHDPPGKVKFETVATLLEVNALASDLMRVLVAAIAAEHEQ